MKQQHNFPPVFDHNSQILILGSFPSVKSREECFFYAHPQNRFWHVLAAVLETAKPEGINEKQAFLLMHHIALWDVIAACEITGSADSSITDIQPNDLRPLLVGGTIKQIFTNGKTADKLYQKHVFPITGLPSLTLPSTSPSNAAWHSDRLIEAWSIIKQYLS